jgi:hypothetical protein
LFVHKPGIFEEKISSRQDSNGFDSGQKRISLYCKAFWHPLRVPEGRIENSPAIYCRVQGKNRLSPEGTAEPSPPQRSSLPKSQQQIEMRLPGKRI